MHMAERQLGKTPEEVAHIFRNGSDDTLKDVVFSFFKEHPDKLFRRRDVVRALTREEKVYSPNSIKSLVLALYNEKQIDRERRSKPRGTFVSYYGAKPAVERVRQLMRERAVEGTQKDQ